MTQQEEKLKVGDVIYRRPNSRYYLCGCIDRVTEKSAFMGSVRFNIRPEPHFGYLNAVGNKMAAYYRETPEIKAAYEDAEIRSPIISRLVDVIFKELPTDKLIAIDKIINSTPTT